STVVNSNLAISASSSPLRLSSIKNSADSYPLGTLFSSFNIRPLNLRVSTSSPSPPRFGSIKSREKCPLLGGTVSNLMGSNFHVVNTVDNQSVAYFEQGVCNYFSFPNPYPDGSKWQLVITQQPYSSQCTITQGASLRIYLFICCCVCVC